MRHEADSIEFVEQTASAEAALAQLNSAISDWFRARFGSPTLAQRLTWPALAAGQNLLLSAPTGTGKTLAAFLPFLSRWFTDHSPWRSASGSIYLLYVAPLKALNNDACRNLESHLADLAPYLPAETTIPRLAVRTGDTTNEERRSIRDCPPEILLTTPESLAVMLSQPNLLPLFANLSGIILDELHALIGTKRGADLAISLERINALNSTEIQRVGLSATATPLTESARFLVGVGRPCTIAKVDDETSFTMAVTPLAEGLRFFADLVRFLEPELHSCTSTLIFTNTRGLAERLSWALRQRMPTWTDAIAVHHSSLSADRRRDVERRFKNGELRTVVSSTSLELGIDIGSVDQVVLVHPPGDVVRLLQRLGRSGHGPGRVRRGLVLTSGPGELIEAAVTVASGRSSQCEPMRTARAPLDVLCQQLLGMACAGTCDAESIYELVRRAAPYRDLNRTDFDAALAYLFGLDHANETWLPARLAGAPESFTIRDQRNARLIRRNLGTIVEDERAPVLLRVEPDLSTDAMFPETRTIGQVDEPFAESLEPGDRFLLDGRCLEFRRRQGSNVVVDEVPGRPRVPRWGGDGLPLSPELATRLYLLRNRAAEALREGADALSHLLTHDYGLSSAAATILADYFLSQESVSEIPDPDTALIEIVPSDRCTTYYIHTPLNRIGNDALARILTHRLARDHFRDALAVAADLGLALVIQGDRFDASAAELPARLRALMAAEACEADLQAALADSPALRERFRRVAFTGLMLLRNPVGKRRRVGGPEWGAHQLFDRVRRHDPAFLLVRQAEREVRSDLCDATTARLYLEKLPTLALRCRWLSAASPFARAWTQPLEVATDPLVAPGEALQRLHAALMGERAADACA